jgi:thiol-disulfide isomerase/thioredoxin
MLVNSSQSLPLGAQAPLFSLPNYQDQAHAGVMVSLPTAAPATVVIFLCNHCPYVVHIRARLIAIAHEYKARGVCFVGINANDVTQYPEDHPTHMPAQGYPFPYLWDADQQIAKAYHAACTPDFFVFDSALRGYYYGRFDGATPGNQVPVTGNDLVHALECLLAGVTPYPDRALPSMGCNIKWR